MAELYGAPLDNDVAGEADIQCEEGAGNPTHQLSAAQQSGPAHLTKPARGQHCADEQHQREKR